MSLCEHCLPWGSVWLYYLCMLDGRGHSWRLSSAIPCEEGACCGPQLAALMNSFTYYSLRSVVRSWGPNQTRTAWYRMKLRVISYRGSSHSSAVFLWYIIVVCYDPQNRDMLCVFILSSPERKQQNCLFNCLKWPMLMSSWQAASCGLANNDGPLSVAKGEVEWDCFKSTKPLQEEIRQASWEFKVCNFNTRDILFPA